MTREMGRSLPCDIDAERLVLGSLLIADERIADLLAILDNDEFALEKHRRIYARIRELYESGTGIDYVTLAEALRRKGQLESCDGLAYLASLSEGLPKIINLDSYVEIVKDKALLRRGAIECWNFFNRCLAGEDDPHELLQQAEVVLSRLGEKRDDCGQWFTPSQVFAAHQGDLDQLLSPSRGGAGLSTPWSVLTRMVCCFQPQDLVIVAARPGMGKTAAALQQALWVTQKQGMGVAYFSLEMAKESLLRRLLACSARVDLQKVRTGLITAEEKTRLQRAAEELEELPLFIDDSHANTPVAISAAFRRLAARHAVGLVIVDHVQLVHAPGRWTSRHHELSAVSHSMKHLAAQKNCTVMILSQLNRDCERERRAPNLSDLKETGSLEEDADVVVLIHRPERCDRDDPSVRGKALFTVAKQRNGPTGEIDMAFLSPFQRFEQIYRGPEEGK